MIWTEPSLQAAIRINRRFRPLAFYPFTDRTAQAVDQSGRGFNGSYSGGYQLGAAGHAPGIPAARFDGVSGNVNLGNSSSLNLQSGYTLKTWVRFDSLAGSGGFNQSFLIARDSSSLGRSFAFGLSGGGTKFNLEVNGGTDAASLAGPPIFAGKWYHLAVTGSPSDGVRLYINASQVASGSWVAINASTGPTLIGSRAYSGYEGYTAGRFALTGIFDRPLSPSELRLDYVTPRLARRKAVYVPSPLTLLSGGSTLPSLSNLNLFRSSMYGIPTLQSSGETPVSTTSDAPVTLLTANTTGIKRSVTIINEGSVAGFFSFDGATWARLPASSTQTFDNVHCTQAVQVKRTSGGANLTGLYAFASY